jgi:arginase
VPVAPGRRGLALSGPSQSVVVGIPIDSYGRPGGTELAPDTLRGLGIVDAVGARDAGDLDVRIVGTERDETSGIIGYPSVVETSRQIRDGIAPLLVDDAFLIVLGGCCTLVPGVAAALRLAHNGPLGLAYIDGHLDTYDGTTSVTGEAADMPVAIVAGIGDRALVELGSVTPLVQPAHIALLGHRDDAEVRELGGLLPAQLGAGISHDAESIRRSDPAELGAEVARNLGTHAGRYWLSIDVDALSSLAFAATPAQQEGGLTADELVALARPLAMDPACLGIDVVCYDVELDDADRTSGRRLVEIMRQILAPA